MTSSPKRLQVALKNRAVRPSRPGALLGFNLNIVRVISSAKGIKFIAAARSIVQL
ncbi:unnamed protein product [Brassica oleracea var. botrytis]